MIIVSESNTIYKQLPNRAIGENVIELRHFKVMITHYHFIHPSGRLNVVDLIKKLCKGICCAKAY